MKEKQIAQTILDQIVTLSPTFLDVIGGASFTFIPENNREFKLKTDYKDINFKIIDKYHTGGLLFTALYDVPFIVCITLNKHDLYDIAIYDLSKDEIQTIENVYAENLVTVLSFSLIKTSTPEKPGKA